MSQIAAQVHVAGHIDAPVHLQAHSTAEAHDHLSHEDSNSGSAESDCAGYHAYVGLYGLVSAHCIETIVQFKSTVKSLAYNLTIVAQSTDSLKIRGPPLYS